eukprot:maker-scaffold41_size498431-snap-gene-0.13 protein:Tk00187 transcript:maker-scaffold41_size498431-snap-gene-0.13-mRNA-1 annotation:"immunoglobulin-binding protein 1"
MAAKDENFTLKEMLAQQQEFMANMNAVILGQAKAAEEQQAATDRSVAAMELVAAAKSTDATVELSNRAYKAHLDTITEEKHLRESALHVASGTTGPALRSGANANTTIAFAGTPVGDKFTMGKLQDGKVDQWITRFENECEVCVPRLATDKAKYKMLAGGMEHRTMDDTSEWSEDSLAQLFGRAFGLYERINTSADDFRSEAFQTEVKKAILMCEDATRAVSLLDIFSRNESVGEMPSLHLPYLLLPALLAQLQTKVYDPATPRTEIIRIAEVYMRDYLQRVKDYEILPDLKIPEVADEELDEPQDNARVPPVGGPPDMGRMERDRKSKLDRYRLQKELEDRVKELQPLMDEKKAETVDDDVLREFHLSSIKMFAFSALDDLGSFDMEKPILAHMEKVKKGQVPDPKTLAQPPRPLKPVIITRDAVQKEVFGLGYRNVPVLSIEEFYEQRVREGWFPDPKDVKKQQKSLQDRPEADIKAEEDEEARIKEAKEDNDDPEELGRKRYMDEYKDEHRRGEGNRYNKG